jgi:hypothetical membrane protein
MILNKGKTAGATLFVGGIQFIILLIIAEAVYPNYSISGNYISDLGVWSEPSAIFFNSSSIVLGALVIVSSFFIYKEFCSRALGTLFALAGAGAMGVGIFPGNTFLVGNTPVIHTTSATLAFIVGAITAIASYKIVRGPFRYFSVILGLFSLVSLVSFGLTRDSGFLGIGVGGMERLIAYPTFLWIIGLGGYLLGLFSRD